MSKLVYFCGKGNAYHNLTNYIRRDKLPTAIFFNQNITKISIIQVILTSTLAEF